MRHPSLTAMLLAASVLACASSQQQRGSDEELRRAQRACLDLVARRGEAANVQDSTRVGRHYEVLVHVTTAFGGERVTRCEYDTRNGKASTQQ